MNKIVFFKKPNELCIKQPENVKHLNRSEFIKYHKKRIHSEIKALDLNLRLAEYADIENLISFMRIRYSKYPPGVAEDVSQYDLYRFIKFGHGLLIEDANKKIQACVYEAPYNTVDKTSYTVRIASSREYAGKGLGFKITEYSSLLAMENGSFVKRALIETTNYASISILINKLGMVCNNFYMNLFSNVGDGITVCIPLDKNSFLQNRIEVNKVVDYIKKHELNIDYKLIEPKNLNELNHLYNIEKRFIIIAFLKKGLINDKNVFFAYPKEKLQIKENIR